MALSCVIGELRSWGTAFQNRDRQGAVRPHPSLTVAVLKVLATIRYVSLSGPTAFVAACWCWGVRGQAGKPDLQFSREWRPGKGMSAQVGEPGPKSRKTPRGARSDSGPQGA